MTLAKHQASDQSVLPSYHSLVTSERPPISKPKGIRELTFICQAAIFTASMGVMLSFLSIPLTSSIKPGFKNRYSNVSSVIFSFTWTVVFSMQFFLIFTKVLKLSRKSRLRFESVLAFFIASYQLHYTWWNSYVSLLNDDVQSFFFYGFLALTQPIIAFVLDRKLDSRAKVSSNIQKLGITVCFIHFCYFVKFLRVDENLRGLTWENSVLPLGDLYLFSSLAFMAFWSGKSKISTVVSSLWQQVPWLMGGYWVACAVTYVTATL